MISKSKHITDDNNMYIYILILYYIYIIIIHGNSVFPHISREVFADRTCQKVNDGLQRHLGLDVELFIVIDDIS